MYVTAEHLRDQVIRPTLKYLGTWTPACENLSARRRNRRPRSGAFLRTQRRPGPVPHHRGTTPRPVGPLPGLQSGHGEQGAGAGQPAGIPERPGQRVADQPELLHCNRLVAVPASRPGQGRKRPAHRGNGPGLNTGGCLPVTRNPRSRCAHAGQVFRPVDVLQHSRKACQSSLLVASRASVWA